MEFSATKTLWNNVLNSLEARINKQSFNTWLKDTEPLSVSDNTIHIKVIDDVTKRHISEQYLGQISHIIKDLTGEDYKCEFVISNGFFNDKKTETKMNNISFNSEMQKSILNPNYTFDNFVVGPNNQLAHAAADSVSRAPGSKVNPLFIYGGTGLGKTHLIQAIGHLILYEKPYLKVLYVPTEQFIAEFINSIRNRTQESFKIKYRNVDILLIDDIQFIENKEETQNEFFHTFNNLHENKKQIVITSDRPPKLISTLADRLRTRFEWGMITDIQPPDLETREAILRNKAEKENIILSDEVLYYIAKRIKSHIRALEAALTRLKMVSTLSDFDGPITVNHAKQHLRDLFNDDPSRVVTISEIMTKVADKTNVSVEEIVSKSRHSRIIQPRFIAMFLTRKLTSMTTTEIGKEFGDRDHSTVINAINKIEEDLNSDAEFKEQIDDLIIELRS